MRVNIHNKKKNPRVDSYVEERLELVVGRFEDRIGHIDVHVLDENGLKGGEDKVCTIDIKLVPRGQLHVRARHNNVYSAIVKAIHRAETVVAKAVDRGHLGLEARHRQTGLRNVRMGPEVHAEGDVEPSGELSGG